MADGKSAKEKRTSAASPTVCLYRNMRLNVKYVYGQPVRFDPARASLRNAKPTRQLVSRASEARKHGAVRPDA